MFESNTIGDYLAQFDVKKFCQMENLNYACRSCLQAFSLDVMVYLRQKHFLIINTKAILPTPLGKAAFASSIAPEESQQIFNDLVEVRQSKSLILESDLHLLYLVTPHLKGLREPNWESFYKVFGRLTSSEMKIAQIYGLRREYLEWAREIKPTLPDFITDKQTDSTANNQNQQELYCVTEQLDDKQRDMIKYCKFYMALVANEVLKETPISEICDTFKCSRGQVQTVQNQALNNSGMMAAFCERLCWTDYSILFLRISEKINWQVKDELLDLMQLPSLRPERARTLYQSGLTTVEELVSKSSVDQLVQLFVKNDGFVTHRLSNGSDLKIKYEYLFSLSHKVMSEAKQLLLKRLHDPDCSKDQAQQDLQNVGEYLMVSDSSDSES